ncbi:hypothetical protein KM043_006776 [Ampulex compressa]|nr:hypothetical protein KM043_006776 [Ampulex compressa]
MTSRVNLITILLALNCAVGGLDYARVVGAEKDERMVSYGRKLLKNAHNKLAPGNEMILRDGGKGTSKISKAHGSSNSTALTKNVAMPKDHYMKGFSRRKKGQMNRTMMALLMAYKMKFIALIPTMLGGLVLLKATAILAGFFFALFAAVLGLKVQ